MPNGPTNRPPIHSHTAMLTTGQAKLLREVLTEEGFDFDQKPYTIFTATKNKLNVAVYEKGPKVLVQGKGLEDFITFILEPRVLGAATFGYEEELHPEWFTPHFGIDESGKGDFLGPLVIAGAYVNPDLARALRDLGIQDSKRITSDKKIRDLAGGIRKLRVPHALVTIAPPRYNSLFTKIGNLNRMLAWGHARVIEDLCEQQPTCPRAVSDQFANEAVLKRALMERGKKIELIQRTKAESDFAVAAASILAREKFINWLDEKGTELSITLPRGVSAAVKSAANEVVSKHGREALDNVAKMHFKTAAEIIGLMS